MPKIYIALPYFDQELAIQSLKGVGTVTIRSENDRPTEDELCEIVQKYDCIIIGIKEIITPKVILYIGSKKFVIGTMSIGLDHIHNSAYQTGSIKIINTPSANSNSVAEYCLAGTLALYKRLSEGMRAVKNRVGRETIELTNDLSGRTVGVIGAGSTGRAFVKIMQPFAERTLIWTRNPDLHEDLTKEYCAQFCSLEEVISKSDIVSVHLPLNEHTEGFINSDVLTQLKANAIFINSSRLGLVDNETLIQLVISKQISGAVIDESIEIDAAAKKCERLIITPHIAGVSKEALARMQVSIVNSISEYYSDLKN